MPGSTTTDAGCIFLPMALAYRVFVVLDRVYGERLSELARIGPVWIVDTTLNRAAAQGIWAERPKGSHLDGVTTFKAGDSSPEDALINELNTIDLHHGSYSADRPYTVLEVIGAVLSESITAELSLFGFIDFQATAEGFRAVRPCRATTRADSWHQIAFEHTSSF
jgi:hypothetical protein